VGFLLLRYKAGEGHFVTGIIIISINIHTTFFYESRIFKSLKTKKMLEKLKIVGKMLGKFLWYIMPIWQSLF